MSKNARRGLAGSLGFRVLSISFVFLAIPLVIYSLFLYFIDYKLYVKNIFEEVDIIAKEEVSWIREKEIYYSNTMVLIQEFIATFHLKKEAKTSDQLTDILRKFTSKQDVEALVYAEVSSKGRLVGKSSTISSYVGMDFSSVFTVSELRAMKDNVFIAKDPLLGYSLYIVQYVDNHGIDAYVMTIISLDELLTKMAVYQQRNSLDISFIDSNGFVLSSTNKDFINKRFSEDKGENTFETKKISYVPNGIYFEYKGKKNFFDKQALPESSVSLVFSIPEQTIMGRFQSFIYRLGFFLLAVLILGGLLTFLLTIRMARPMKNLLKVMDGVGSGDLETQYENDKYGFEINRLGESFNQMTKHLLEHIEAVKKERGLKEAFEKELQIGHQIQKALLPSHEEVIEGVDIASFYSPAKEVAGDFYDYGPLDEDKTLITIADGVGKGISSCLYSFDLRSILKTAAQENQPLNDLIVKTNNLFCEDTKESCNFVTAVVGYLNRKDKTYQFTNAGHLPVIVKRTNQNVETFTTQGIALGVQELEKVEVETISLQEGDYCICYTDGVSEAQNEKGELYTEERLLESVRQFKGSNSHELVDAIMNGVHEFVANKEQYDDITLLVFKFQSS
ncbi:MAG: hypothetical protein S4CHLAM20_12400 [Chlamydiia bacterium]|nr:hypothetical protein [Chlamydiia bacterium]